MTVPASKRGESPSEFVRRCREVWRQMDTACSKLPKRKSFTQAQHVLGITYAMLEAAATADAVYASTPVESRLRLEQLNLAYGKLAALCFVLDSWADRPPKRVIGERGPAGEPLTAEVPFISDRQLQALAGSIYSAMSAVKGSIKYERSRLRRLEGKEHTGGEVPE